MGNNTWSVYINEDRLGRRGPWIYISCADPESFVRGGLTFTPLFFIFMRGGGGGGKDHKTTISGISSAEDDPTLNAGFIALSFLWDPDQYC